MTLPGKATLTVQSLPLLGWKTAVGFEVSIAALSFVIWPLGVVLDSAWRLRFCNKSGRNIMSRLMSDLSIGFAPAHSEHFDEYGGVVILCV